MDWTINVYSSQGIVLEEGWISTRHKVQRQADACMQVVKSFSLWATPYLSLVAPHHILLKPGRLQRSLWVGYVAMSITCKRHFLNSQISFPQTSTRTSHVSTHNISKHANFSFLMLKNVTYYSCTLLQPRVDLCKTKWHKMSIRRRLTSIWLTLKFQSNRVANLSSMRSNNFLVLANSQKTAKSHQNYERETPCLPIFFPLEIEYNR